jgi:hypothetical protein
VIIVVAFLSMMGLKECMSSDDESADQLRQRLVSVVADAPELTEVLRGTLGERFVCCGKAGCHCREGLKHGSVYFLSVSQGGGHTLQVTLSREAYENAQQYVANYARLGEIMEEVSRLNRELLRVTQQRKRAPRRGK